MATSVQRVVPPLLDSKAVQPPLFNGTASTQNDQKCGGWTPIKDVSDPHVIEIAQFAVDEYNKRSHAALIFERVIRGWTQVVCGINYKLIIEAKHAEAFPNQYEALVYEIPWQTFKELISFVPLLRV